MKELMKGIAILAVAGIFLAGCNAGMAPAGSDDGRKAEVQKMSLQDKIDDINRSPLPPQEKQKKIDEAKKAAGQPDAPGTATGFAPGDAGGAPAGAAPAGTK